MNHHAAPAGYQGLELERLLHDRQRGAANALDPGLDAYFVSRLYLLQESIS
ncbi:hypothetical protein NDN68_11720 [Stenotrophomonas maltophilia]|nr:hypothetical protein [Stenotrophomonas maltophilia]MCM2520652.1 hypothetical protein [Stenotrophomonas maltophilia]